jgi:hypothetical protein
MGHRNLPPCDPTLPQPPLLAAPLPGQCPPRQRLRSSRLFAQEFERTILRNLPLALPRGNLVMKSRIRYSLILAPLYWHSIRPVDISTWRVDSSCLTSATVSRIINGADSPTSGQREPWVTVAAFADRQCRESAATLSRKDLSRLSDLRPNARRHNPLSKIASPN